MQSEETKKKFWLAERLLKSYPERKLSNETKARYLQTGERHFCKHQSVMDTCKKGTYYLRKAAITFYALEQLRYAIAHADEALLDAAVLTLGRFDTKLSGQPAVNAGRKCPLKNTLPRCSKRQSLRGLQANWRERLLSGVTGKAREILLVLCAGGVRPEEIASGVLVTPHENGVILEVKGAKVSQSNGQPLRIFFVSSPFAAELAIGGKRIITGPSANAISQAVGRQARKVFGRRTHNVSAYSFRHQFAADLKSASNISDDDISAIMGHSASDTKRHYGTRSQSRSNIRVRLISASREVRPKQSWSRPQAGPALF